MLKVILIGINPSGKPFRKGCSLDKMNIWMESLGFYHYSFSNVIPYPGEYRIKDVDLSFISDLILDYDKVIALGGFVSRVLTRIEVSHFTLPHPSPLNRLLNSKEYELSCIDSCKKWLSV